MVLFVSFDHINRFIEFNNRMAFLQLLIFLLAVNAESALLEGAFAWEEFQGSAFSA